MKKLFCLALFFISLFSLSSCNESMNKEPIKDEFIITFDSAGGTLVEKQTVSAGNKGMKPNSPTKDGFEFEGWYWNETPYDFSLIVKEDMTLTAKWSIAKVVVTFDTQGGSTVNAVEVTKGGKVTKPATDPTKADKVFAGWYKESACTTPWNFDTDIVNVDITIYAKWNNKQEQIELKGYYAPMNQHLDSTFKTSLHRLLKETHKNQLSYSEVWTALKVLDKDPSNGDNVLCIYTGKSIPIANQDKGSAGDNLWNREHSWPNSHGFSSKDYAAYTDLHHLFASEKNINATRGNKDFNTVSNGSSDSYGNKWNSTFFEPRDEVKGDLARAMFYLVVRYDDPTELDLELSESSTSSSSNKTGQLGVLSVLLEWHLLDPVSDEERLRNEGVYEMQGNRNPFIDYPEWVNLLYPLA